MPGKPTLDSLFRAWLAVKTSRSREKARLSRVFQKNINWAGRIVKGQFPADLFTVDAIIEEYGATLDDVFGSQLEEPLMLTAALRSSLRDPNVVGDLEQFAALSAEARQALLRVQGTLRSAPMPPTGQPAAATPATTAKASSRGARDRRRRRRA